MKKGLTIILGWVLFISSYAYALETHTKFWQSNLITGPLGYQGWQYYFEPQLRLIDDAYKFNQALFLAGVGYPLNPNVIAYGGLGWVIGKNLSGNIYHEYRIWQQINWSIITEAPFLLANRVRLEERTNSLSSGLSVRLRERLFGRFLFSNWPAHSLAMFDEMIMNLTMPPWVPDTFVDQNRAFIGIGTQVNKHVIVDVGYLNQYVWSSPNQMSHVLLVMATFTF